MLGSKVNYHTTCGIIGSRSVSGGLRDSSTPATGVVLIRVALLHNRHEQEDNFLQRKAVIRILPATSTDVLPQQWAVSAIAICFWEWSRAHC